MQNMTSNDTIIPEDEDYESQSILALHKTITKKKHNNPSVEENATNTNENISRNVVSLGSHRTGMPLCSCPQNAKAVAFRYLLNQIPEEKLEIFWKDVLEVVNKHKK